MQKLFILILFMINGGFAFAQKFEISVGYGAPSAYGISNEIGSSLFNGIINDADSPNSVGALGVSALVYSKEDKWRYGLDVVSEFFSVSNSNYTQMSTLSIMPRTDYFWSNSDRKLRLYTGVSAGVYLNRATVESQSGTEEKVKNTTFGFNVTPIGLRYGSQFAIFAEPNIGTKGIVQAGISYRF